eukprot:g997.t1
MARKANVSSGWFATHAHAFRRFHTTPFNVAAHLVTTPLCIAASLALAIRLGVPNAVAMAFVVAWVLSLWAVVPSLALWLGSATFLTACTGAAWALLYASLSHGSLACLFLLGYFGQDMAHYLASEATYQSSYATSKWGAFGAMLVSHTYLLVPLVLDACAHTPHGSLADLVAQRTHVVSTKLPPALVRGPLRHLAAWVLAKTPPRDKTSHWWAENSHNDEEHTLPAAERAAFEAVVDSPAMRSMFRKHFNEQGYEIEPVRAMNEVYVATAARDEGDQQTSDTVFYMDHIDGPYGMFPSSTKVFRCMVGITQQERIETVFKLNNDRCRFTLSEGDVAGFDFHREVHRIQPVVGGKPLGPNQYRVCLKLHYAVYARSIAPLGRLLAWLTVRYNVGFRALFLATIDPASLRARFMAWWVVNVTWATASFEAHVGWSNILYLFSLGMASWATGSHTLWLLGSCFAHYVVYASTYHARARGIAFGLFKRDAVLFKSVALAQAFAIFMQHFQSDTPDWGALALMGLGFALSSAATRALGIDRTYFGWEVGAIKGKYVASWPYGSIPHPMIVGSITAWLGFHKLVGFRTQLPWFAPLHVALYLAHMAQEHVAVHSTGKLKKAC